MAAAHPARVDRSVELDLSSPLIIGFGVASQAAAAALVARGHRPTVVEDHPNDANRTAAAALGLTLVEAPNAGELESLVQAATLLLPSPGVPDHHPVFGLAARMRLQVASEFDLAQSWDDRPVVAITGTNGKTTVTTMVADALNRSAIAAEPVGNTDVPFVQSIEDPETAVFVVEASSFRLAHSCRFRPNVAAWLNFAPDHLDAHATLERYEQAKASIWADLPPGATIVANADDAVVTHHLNRLDQLDRPGSDDVDVQLFSITTEATWWVDRSGGNAVLVGPDGPFMDASDLTRRQPHDVSNALAVAALATAAGASMEAITETLRTFAGLAHRLEYLGSAGEVGWYNDSKATVPHATVAAVGGFESVVLIAGGYDKGLAFEPLRSTVPPVRSVVAIGDAAEKIAAVFAELVPVTVADSMSAAIAAADSIADAGDAVLLSPACASFDWYPNYVERGLDYSARVRAEVLNR